MGKVPQVGCLFPQQAHGSLQSARLSKHPKVVMEWRQGSDRKGEISPPMGSIVSRNVGGKKDEWSRVRTRGRGAGMGSQNDSSCPTERSPLGVEARDEPLSMLSEPELWCCCSEPALEVMVDEDVEEERVFSLKSVMITVTFPTVIANCWAVLRSMFFSLGLRGTDRKKKRKKNTNLNNLKCRPKCMSQQQQGGGCQHCGGGYTKLLNSLGDT